jgi:prolyl-tRNA editing enzyme YbaK/EbsC (Cys-tRNA(Pro) deacylase)
MTKAYTQILERLEASKLPFTEHTHPELRTVEDLKTHLSLAPEQMFKTLVFRVAERWILIQHFP